MEYKLNKYVVFFVFCFFFEGHSAYNLKLRQSNGPLVRQSNGPLVRQSNGPLVRQSNGPLVRQSNGPLVRQSNGPLVRWPDKQTIQKPLIVVEFQSLMSWMFDSLQPLTHIYECILCYYRFKSIEIKLEKQSDILYRLEYGF